MRNRVPLAPVVLLAALTVLGGCGGPSNPVAGVVIRNEAPIPNGHGLVQFTPDIDKGTTGPSALLKIKDGKFSSADDRQPIAAGEHLVTVMVLPPGSQGETLPEEFRFRVTVPEGGKGDLVFDISKPRPAGRKRPQD